MVNKIELGKYNAQEIEKKYRDYWEKQGTYSFDPKNKAEIFSIDNPPPTVSGQMHIGHAFQYSQQDFIARFKRMSGKSVFYPFGTDDNGLPTERLIERLKNVKSKDMSRAEFIKLCLKTLKEITPDFIQDWKNIGISSDYSLAYSTIDDNSRKLSQKSFIDLYNQKLVYTKEFPTIWCPECQTAIAQAELEDKELGSQFSTIKFSSDGKDLLIATTRPELIPACVAIFYNPKDKRFKHLKGKKAKIPLFDYEVPILADESADLEKGTGMLMVCSYGDKFDVEAINKHKLSPRIILNQDGTLNKLAQQYKDLRIKKARKQILEDLDKAGLITEKKEITHTVNVHDRCGTEIEFITTQQWFIKLLDKKNKFLSQGKKVDWLPNFMYKRYENWVKGLEWDWSISRDRHFGIPIPVWYCDKCNEIILASEKELPIDPIQTSKECPKCKAKARPEEKVLDTWATSSITPQICSSLVNNKIKVPFSIRCNAHDIIRTWDFYTIVKSLYHENQIPWQTMMVSGFVTLGKEKMSKSKGNTVKPQEVIKNYSADALRFWASGSKLGEDLDYQEQDIVTGKKFINKLWNASKFTFMNLEDYSGKKPKKLEKIDQEFLDRLDNLITAATSSFEKFEYSKVRQSVERFFWNMFCDNYLEIIKNRIYNATGDKKLSAQYTLYTSLLEILKMIAPIMPFVTEELYRAYFKQFEKSDSIHTSAWPTTTNKTAKQQVTKELDLFLDLLAKIRQEKTRQQKSMKAELILTLEKAPQTALKDMLDDFKAVTGTREIKTGKFKIEFI